MIILYILLGLIVGSLGVYLLLRPKLKLTAQKNLAIEQENQKLEIENANLNDLKKNREELLHQAEKEYLAMGAKREEIRESLENLKETQTRAADDIFVLARQNAEQAFDDEVERINQELEANREQADKEYKQTLKELVEDFSKEAAAAGLELSKLRQELAETKSIVDSAVADRKRAIEMEEKSDFYKLQLSHEDIQEIAKLREVLPYLRDKEPLNKVIYKVYYEKPYTDLVGRVLGQGKRTGIYKITNTKNGMCYVGQTLNGHERFRQHIKRGVGAEPATRNKLYPAMLEFGVENFTFEWIEDCDAAFLDEREQYWQEYFHAKDFGYSIK